MLIFVVKLALAIASENKINTIVRPLMCFEIISFISAIPLFLNNKLTNPNIASCIVINNPFAELYILLNEIENIANNNITIPKRTINIF